MALTLGRAQARRLRTAQVAVAVCALIGLLVGVVILAVLPHGHVHALDAAGAFKGGEIEGVAKFAEKLKGNVVWLGGTAMGLVIAVVGIMFMAGHSRAHDVAIKTIAGLAILASISGIVA
ncbi:MAG TPA: hypothetical protein VES97_08750 [Solirubrobacteraceae bacterium]|nr:hypothetical protein [Solirubrobacteraceae bacterium]